MPPEASPADLLGGLAACRPARSSCMYLMHVLPLHHAASERHAGEGGAGLGSCQAERAAAESISGGRVLSGPACNYGGC